MKWNYTLSFTSICKIVDTISNYVQFDKKLNFIFLIFYPITVNKISYSIDYLYNYVYPDQVFVPSNNRAKSFKDILNFFFVHRYLIT